MEAAGFHPDEGLGGTVCPLRDPAEDLFLREFTLFHVIFINQEVVFYNRFHIFPFFRTVQDLLLVMERNLGVRDQDGRDKGVG